MAIRTRIKNGIGMVAPPSSQAAKEGELAPVVQSILDYLRDVLVPSINGRLSLGNGDQSTQAGNLDMQWITYTFSSVANTEAEIPHGLGRVPIGCVPVQKDRACDVYVSNLSGWGQERFFLKCSVASATVNLLVF